MKVSTTQGGSLLHYKGGSISQFCNKVIDLIKSQNRTSTLHIHSRVKKLILVLDVSRVMVFLNYVENLPCYMSLEKKLVIWCLNFSITFLLKHTMTNNIFSSWHQSEIAWYWFCYIYIFFCVLLNLQLLSMFV